VSGCQGREQVRSWRIVNVKQCIQFRHTTEHGKHLANKQTNRFEILMCVNVRFHNKIFMLNVVFKTSSGELCDSPVS